MSSCFCGKYRDDIEKFIKENKKVSEKDIWDKFFDGKNRNMFELELKTLVDKSKKAFEMDREKGINSSYIKFDKGYYTIEYI